MSRWKQPPALPAKLSLSKSKDGFTHGSAHLAVIGIRSFAQVVTGASRGSSPLVEHNLNPKIIGFLSSLEWLHCSTVAMVGGSANFDALSSALFKDLLGLSSFNPWNGEIVNHTRLIWISCVCLPLSLWNIASFKSIAGLWGSLVAVDDSTSNCTNMSKSRLLIETECSDVGGKIVMLVGEVPFDVVVVEEEEIEKIGPWPECISMQSSQMKDCSVVVKQNVGSVVSPFWACDVDKASVVQVIQIGESLGKSDVHDIPNGGTRDPASKFTAVGSIFHSPSTDDFIDSSSSMNSNLRPLDLQKDVALSDGGDY